MPANYIELAKQLEASERQVHTLTDLLDEARHARDTATDVLEASERECERLKTLVLELSESSARNRIDAEAAEREVTRLEAELEKINGIR